MQDRLASRLDTLREEYRNGQTMLAELESKEAGLRQTLLRISGAIQVLEELLAQAEPSPPDGSSPSATAPSGAPVNADA
jgi:hypothetical protein